MRENYRYFRLSIDVEGRNGCLLTIVKQLLHFASYIIIIILDADILGTLPRGCRHSFLIY